MFLTEQVGGSHGNFYCFSIGGVKFCFREGDSVLGGVSLWSSPPYPSPCPCVTRGYLTVAANTLPICRKPFSLSLHLLNVLSVLSSSVSFLSITSRVSSASSDSLQGAELKYFVCFFQTSGSRNSSHESSTTKTTVHFRNCRLVFFLLLLILHACAVFDFLNSFSLTLFGLFE